MSCKKEYCTRYRDGYCAGYDEDCEGPEIPGIEEKIIYITKDKQRFDTIKEAHNHIEDTILKGLDRMVQVFVKGNTTACSIDRKDQIALVTYLHKNREKLMAIFAIERKG